MKLNLTDTEVRKVCAAVDHVINELKVLPLAESTEGRARCMTRSRGGSRLRPSCMHSAQRVLTRQNE